LGLLKIVSLDDMVNIKKSMVSLCDSEELRGIIGQIPDNKEHE